MKKIERSRRRWEYETYALCYQHAKQMWEHAPKDQWREVDTSEILRYAAVVGYSMPCNFCEDGADCEIIDDAQIDVRINQLIGAQLDI